jgi:hypothetical protein
MIVTLTMAQCGVIDQTKPKTQWILTTSNSIHSAQSQNEKSCASKPKAASAKTQKQQNLKIPPAAYLLTI